MQVSIIVMIRKLGFNMIETNMIKIFLKEVQKKSITFCDQITHHDNNTKSKHIDQIHQSQQSFNLLRIYKVGISEIIMPVLDEFQPFFLIFFFILFYL